MPGIRPTAIASRKLLRELVAHLRQNRAQLRHEWAKHIRDAKLLTVMSKEEIFSEATSVYDNYLEVLETGSVAALQAYARDLSERIIPRGVETYEVLGIVLLLRDILARSLFRKYQNNFDLLSRVLDAYEPAANRIANTVGVSFVEQRERVIRRQQMAIQVLHVQEEERKRISRELHDEVGQALTAINMNLAVLQRDGLGEDPALRKRIADIGALLSGAMATIHSFARELRPTMLEELGLLPALRSYLKEYVARTGLMLRFKGSVQEEDLSAEQKTVLFRVAQESLTNVAKHAHAGQVDVTLCSVKNGIRMQIKDDGQGFVVNRQQRGKRRLGLLGMQERVGLVDGRLVVQSALGRGTIIRVEIPRWNGKKSDPFETALSGRNRHSPLFC